jgi:universal stress protein E
MKTFRNVLFVHSDGPGNDAALRQAFALASAHGGTLAVISVTKALPGIPDLRNAYLDYRRAQVDQVLTAAIAQTESPKIDLSAISVSHLEGEPFLEIIRDVLKEDRDIVIKAAEADSRHPKRGFSSQDLQLLRQCPCPVWLFKPTENDPAAPRLLAAIDPSESGNDALSRRIVEIAAGLRSQLGASARLDIVHCWELPHEQSFRNHPFLRIPDDRLDDIVRSSEILRRNAVETALAGMVDGDDGTKIRLEKGDPVKLVPQIAQSEGIDLVVMGTVARTGIPGLFIGNTAESILSGLPCSLLAIKPPGFRSAITLG